MIENCCENSNYVIRRTFDAGYGNKSRYNICRECSDKFVFTSFILEESKL